MSREPDDGGATAAGPPRPAAGAGSEDGTAADADVAEVVGVVQAVQRVLTDLAGIGTTGAAPEPVEGDGADRSVADLLAALVILRRVREELSAWEPLLIAAARSRGASWASLAPALGVTSRQAAERRYLRLQPSATGESTGEERVRAERTRRAGDRAVTRWARQNSASLRQLAGQVSALTDLAPSARDRADVVGRALADDDPAALLSPLADARSHLPPRHAALAERIRSVTEHTEQVRRDTTDRRAEEHRQTARHPAGRSDLEPDTEPAPDR